MMNVITRVIAAWRMANAFDPLLLARARELMTELDTRPESGEWKRHQVYARLLKEYPGLRHSTVALAIEVVKCSG